MSLPKPLIIGNWKMHGLSAELETLVRALAKRHAETPKPGTLGICPPFTLLIPAKAVLQGSGILLGGQTCHAKGQGAFTGDISAAMLADAGCEIVLLGHSERRAGLGETDADVKAKAEATLSAGLTPVVCIGETEDQYVAGETLDVLGAQIDGSLPDGADAERLVVAYEPIWAIGTGRTPTMDEIAKVHAFIGERLAAAGVSGTPVLYGGSVKPDNAAAILALDGVDGVLVGGASLKVDDFFTIYAAGAGTAA
ncbi:triose-phosphate isomerase [Marinivivus vitaminiproducens]|uniref:triose-phosphate isomerase n=1 Tax=Marinivivus vitaminiproducens TaxID=3035935 RepID=UPI00279A9FD2|nr:triose-phosphate isomerase [Geminicoccaceae bacterium SCSIO 64248]